MHPNRSARKPLAAPYNGVQDPDAMLSSTMLAMTTEESVRDSLVKLVQEVFSEPHPEGRIFEPVGDPAAEGSVLRVPDALLVAVGLSTPQSVCVLRRDVEGVLMVPIRLHPRDVGPGEVLIPEDESPFSDPVVLCVWCPLRVAPSALSTLRPIARIPTAERAAIVARSLTPPRTRLGEWQAWQRLIAGISAAVPDGEDTTFPT